MRTSVPTRRARSDLNSRNSLEIQHFSSLIVAAGVPLVKAGSCRGESTAVSIDSWSLGLSGRVQSLASRDE